MSSSRSNRLPAYFQQPFKRSIRFRLTAIFVAIFGITLILFSAILYQNFVSSHQNEFDAALYNHAVDVAQGIDVNFFGDLSVQREALTSGGKIFPFSKVYLQILGEDGRILARSRALGTVQLKPDLTDLKAALAQTAVFKNMSGRSLPQLSAEQPNAYRLIYYRISKAGLPRLVLMIAAPLTMLERERGGLLTFFFIMIPITLILATLGGLFLSRRALAPVSSIIRKSKEITASHLSERVPVPDTDDEIKQLALTLNELLNRLQRSFESQEQFIADASHQLKTPLAILRGELDVIRSKARSADEVAQFMASASQEIDYLSRMVEDLLLLARVDSESVSVPVQIIRLDEILLEAVARLEPLAKKKNAHIRLNLMDEKGERTGFEAKGDPDLLQCMLQNLIDNAIKFSPEGGTVEVTLFDEATRARIAVKDQGPGIPPETAAKIFDRFYRAETTRYTAPGTGLGLPIARRIAEAHGGSLHVESVVGIGTTFFAEIKK